MARRFSYPGPEQWKLLVEQGGLLLHGSGVQLDGTGLLIIGKRGGGKSTLSAAALRLGGRIVSDDLLVATLPESGCVELRSLRDHMILREGGVHIVPPRLRALLRSWDQPSGRRWVLVRGDAPDAYVDVSSPRLLWYTSVDRRRSVSACFPMTRAEALSTVMTATSAAYFFSPEIDRARLLRVATALGNGCAGWRIRLGRDVFRDPERVVEELHDATTCPPAARPLPGRAGSAAVARA